MFVACQGSYCVYIFTCKTEYKMLLDLVMSKFSLLQSPSSCKRYVSEDECKYLYACL